jgi:hypothetical protein
MRAGLLVATTTYPIVAAAIDRRATTSGTDKGR